MSVTRFLRVFALVLFLGQTAALLAHDHDHDHDHEVAGAECALCLVSTLDDGTLSAPDILLVFHGGYWPRHDAFIAVSFKAAAHSLAAARAPPVR